MLADAIKKMDALAGRMDALETGEGSKNPIKGDAAKKSDDDDDDKKADATVPKNKICDDEEEEKKDDSSKKSDDDDDDKKDDAFPVKKADAKKSDDGELEIKHEPEEKKTDKRKDSKKSDAFPPKKADSKKADDDDDKKDDDDDDKKDDAAKADSVASLRRQMSDQAATIRRLESLMKPKSDDEHAAFADAQARADTVFNGFGQRAPRPLEGEALIDYRKRLATRLKSYSPVWKSVKFSQLPEEAFGIAETQVYSDAIAAASNPTDLEAGELRQVTKTDPTTGVRTINFYGKESFVKQLGRPGRRVASFRTLASQ
jgi:hypothetical protein